MKKSLAFSTSRRACNRVVIAAAATLLFTPNAYAHPIHTTLTKVTVEDHAITFNVRAFADDFSATVAKFAGRKAPADSSAPASDVLRYAQTYLTVSTADGKPVTLESCGI
ncbi:MAG: DUF6702 family protein, partial [Gemmatimonadaceae bacterium]